MLERARLARVEVDSFAAYGRIFEKESLQGIGFDIHRWE